MGNLAGVWLLAPELLRLGAWDLVCSWTTQRPERVEPRLALQLIHEAALCTTGLRHRRTVNQHIFELANGLPFLATTGRPRASRGSNRARQPASPSCLGQDAPRLGRFPGTGTGHRSHRVRSFSKRHMRRHRDNQAERPTKVAPTFFVLDADTHQPVCFTTATSARTATTAAEELLELAAHILDTSPERRSSWPMRSTSPSNCWTRSRQRRTLTSWCRCPISRPAKKLQGCHRKHSDPLGRLCHGEAALHPQGQPGGTVLPIRPAAGRAARGVPFQGIPLDPDGDEVERLTGTFPSGGTSRSSSTPIRRWAGTEPGHAI